ncbi:MAG: hypothetical protein HRU51_08775 [Xanthomonadales bacterium]|nr:hypothetical protein [Xanthomonadales bacterium]
MSVFRRRKSIRISDRLALLCALVLVLSAASSWMSGGAHTAEATTTVQAEDAESAPVHASNNHSGLILFRGG